MTVKSGSAPTNPKPMTFAQIKANLPTEREVRRWFLPAAVVAVVLAGVFWLAWPAAADFTDLVKLAIGEIAKAIVGFLGSVMLIVVGVLVNVAQYNDFVTEPHVGNGWVIVRDVCNMFFIMVLLLMAFGTIIPGLGNFTVKGGNLTRLIVTAIVINFSRTICGLLIDLSQVVMLTFVSGFKEAAGGNFVNALGVNQVLQANPNSQFQDLLAIIAAYLLAIVMTAIALFTVTVITVSLIVRIIYLWLLIILSPLAFFSRAVPAGFAGGIYARWWGKFTSMLVTGPLQAFFLWLALITVQAGNLTTNFKTASTGESIGGVSAVFSDNKIQQFLIATCLLLVGNQLAKEMGGEAVGMGNKVANFAKRKAAQYGKAAARMTGRAAVAGASRVPVSFKRDSAGQLRTLGSTLAVGRENFKQTRLARTFTKEGRQDSANMRRAAALEASGRKEEADELRKEVYTKRGKVLSRKPKQELEAMARGETTSSRTEKAAAAMALAQKAGKDDPMMQMSKADIGAMSSKAGGGALLTKMISETLKSKGAAFTDVDAAGLSKMDGKELAPLVRKGQMTLAPDGSMANQALDKFYRSGLKDEQIDSMNPKEMDVAVQQMEQGIASHQSQGREAEAKELAAALERIMNNKLSTMKPTDYKNMSNVQRKAFDEQMATATEAQAQVGDDAAAERMRVARMRLSGKDGMLGGIAQETAAGNTDNATQLMDSYMKSFGKENMDMSKKKFDSMVPSKQQEMINELGSMLTQMREVGHSAAGDVEAKMMQLAEGTGIMADTDGTVADWQNKAAEKFGEDAQVAAKAFADMASKAGAARSAAVASGKADQSDFDKAVSKALGGMGKGAERARPASDAIDRLVDQLREGVDVDLGDMQDVATIAEGHVLAALDAGKMPTVTGADGNAMSKEDVYQKSLLSSHLQAAQSAQTTKAAEQHLRAAAQELQRMSSRANRSNRQAAAERQGQAVSQLESTETGLAGALERGDPKVRRNETRKAASSGLSAIKIMFDGGKPGANRVGRELPKLTKQQQENVVALKAQLKKLSSVKQVGDEETKMVRESIAQLQDIIRSTK
jgi:hypothetical protein